MDIDKIERIKKDIKVFKVLFDIYENPVKVEHLDEISAKQKLFKDHIKMYENIIKTQQSEIEKLEADKLELARAIVDNQILGDTTGEQLCNFCGNDANEIHEPECILWKAKKYIKVEGRWKTL